MKKDKLNELMTARSPIRKTVKAVDLYESERSSERFTERSNERNTRTDEPNDRTVTPNGKKTQPKKSAEVTGKKVKTNNNDKKGGGLEKVGVKQSEDILTELEAGESDKQKQLTERYSFEIFTDQKKRLRDLQYSYEKKTGEKLSASRVLREALEKYLNEAERVAGR